MKTKSIFISALLIFSVTILKAQLYLGLGAGYCMPTYRSVIGYNVEQNNPGNTFSDENVIGSYGKGIDFGGYLGYKINDNVGIELGVNYLMGGKYTFTQNFVNGNGTDNRSTDMRVKSLRLNPSIRIGYGDGKFRPYSHAGLTIGVMNKMTSDYSRTFSNPGTTDITLETSEYTGGTYIGFTAGLGVMMSLSDKLSLFGEFTAYYISWAARTGEITSSTFNGADELGSMTTNEKHFEYVDKVDQSMNTNSSQPTQELRTFSPMGSLGITIGLHFAFGE